MPHFASADLARELIEERNRSEELLWMPSFYLEPDDILMMPDDKNSRDPKVQ